MSIWREARKVVCAGAEANSVKAKTAYYVGREWVGGEKVALLARSVAPLPACPRILHVLGRVTLQPGCCLRLLLLLFGFFFLQITCDFGLGLYCLLLV